MSWLDRLRGGFQKTADRVAGNLTGLANRAALDTSTLDDIEEALIASDLKSRSIAPHPRGDCRARSSSALTSAAFEVDPCRRN